MPSGQQTDVQQCGGVCGVFGVGTSGCLKMVSRCKCSASAACLQTVLAEHFSKKTRAQLLAKMVEADRRKKNQRPGQKPRKVFRLKSKPIRAAARYA